MPDTMRRALGLALQILEDMPPEYRPESDIEDMRHLLDGQSSGRDGYITAKAVATALAYRAAHAVARPINWESDIAEVAVNNRIREFASLFKATAGLDYTVLGLTFG